MKLHSTILATAFTAFTTFSADAALIIWGAPTNITPGLAGDLDVSTAGTLVDAFNIGPTGTPNTTVNGVTFASFAYPTATTSSYTQGNYKVEVSLSNLGSASSFGSVAAPFSSLSAPYQTLLRSGGGGSSGATYTLTMSALTVGATYEFQWWSNDSTASINGSTATAGGAVTLDSNVGNVSGGLGQFAIGTFIADNASQEIDFTRVAGATISIVNGFQLRQLAPAAVPEPGTALAGVMLAGLLGVRRRRAS